MVTLPPFIRDVDYVTDRPLAAMTTASAGGLHHLDLVHGRTLQSLNHLLLRTESVDSSKIEDVEASLADYGRALLGEGASSSARSMASATAAMTRIIGDAGRTRTVSAESILRGHRDLFARDPSQQHNAGRFRTRQNWVGGSDYAPRDTLHVPPPPETVPAYIEDLFAFANRKDVPLVVQAAIVHAQFESIHPFIDGNGRIGRALIHAVLRRGRGTQHLTVPIASALVAHRERYFGALNDYRDGYAYTLIAMLARAITTATTESWSTAGRLHEIREEWHDRLGGTRPGTPLHRLLDLLTEEPILNIDLVLARTGATDVEARADIGRLTQAGILTRVPRTRRAPVWSSREVLGEIEDLSTRIRASSMRIAETR